MVFKKKFGFIILLAMVCALSLCLAACGNKPDDTDKVVVEKDANGSEYVLSEDGAGYELRLFSAGDKKEVVIPTEFNNLPITTLSAKAMSQCAEVTKITVPEGVSVKSGALYGCSSLETLVMPEIGYRKLGELFGKTAFENAELISQDYSPFNTDNDYYFPISLKNIELTNCSVLFTRTFNCCKYLEKVKIEGSVTNVGVCIFGDCKALKEVIIPETVERISASAFADCPLLETINLPSGLRFIEDFAFMNDIALKSIDLPDLVQYIGLSSFNGCSGLERVTIGKGAKAICNFAFAYCYKLSEINYNAVEADWRTGKNMVFADVGRDTEGVTLNIGKDVTIIPSLMFNPSGDEHQTKITRVVFEEGSQCTSIGGSAFAGSTSLKEIRLPSTIQTIGGSAFYGCTSLESITIPAAVNVINASAFKGCTSLTSIKFLDTSGWVYYYTSTYTIAISVSNPSDMAIKMVSGDYKDCKLEKK